MITIKTLTILFVIFTVACANDLDAQESCQKKNCAGCPRRALIKKDVDINTNSDIHLFLLPSKFRNSRFRKHSENLHSIKQPNRNPSKHCYGFSHLGKLGHIINEEIENTDSLSEGEIKRTPNKHFKTHSCNTDPSDNNEVLRKLAKRPRGCRH